MELAKEIEHPLTESVELALDSIRPWLIADGGNVKIHNITPDNVVMLELLGNCGNCRMSAMTLKAGVEDAIRREVPQITAVIAINSLTE